MLEPKNGYRKRLFTSGVVGWISVPPTGFAHNALLSNAGAIVDAVKAGAIKHFFLIGGCDGAKQDATTTRN